MTESTRMSATKLALLGRQTWNEQGGLRNAEPIAIIGMGCRYPGGVNHPEGLWELLMAGRDAVVEVPSDRWSVDDWFDPDPSAPGRVATRWGGFLDDIRGFDAAFFDISPLEAERMDPQQRLALEVACEAVEYAGIPLESLRGSDAGVFIASYHNDYTLLQYTDLGSVSARTLTGTLQSVVANRISYCLGLHGPSLAVDSACSSSLVAIHLACQALRARDCGLAIAGGVSVMITPHVTVALSKGGFMSPTGRCRTFDAAADGFVRSEGCANVVLKRLADAIADGDEVLAVIRGSAVNQDGESTNLAAPNGLAQETLIRKALANAGVGPEDISLLEAHGTGTQLGDPIETDAVSAVFRARSVERGPCYLSSLKANLGHCEAAAGVGGLIKAVLCLRNRTVPPSVHFHQLNTHIDLSDTPFQIVDRPTPWAPPGNRIAGVSSFGVGGTNAHIVVEEAPTGLQPAIEPPSPPFVLPLAARSAESLRDLCVAYSQRLTAEPEHAGHLVRAAGRRRTHYRDYRAAPVAASAEALAELLAGIADGMTRIAEPVTEPLPLCFVFSGQGTQWAGMGLALYENEPVFRDTLERVEALWSARGGPSLIGELRRALDESRMDRTDIAQVALFGVQMGITELLAAWGIRPTLVMGHSVGEIAAVCAAGMLDMEKALQVAHERGRVMQSTYDAGRMASVRASEEEVMRHLSAEDLQVSVAALNSPTSVVLSGAVDDIERACRCLKTKGCEVRRLDVRFGFHSHLMMESAGDLRQSLHGLVGEAARVPFVSTVSGRELDRLDADYLARNIESPVRFAAAVDHALAAGVRHFIEIGPHPALGQSILEVAETRGTEAHIGFTLHRDRPPALTLRSVAARAFEWGADPDWAAVDPGPCLPARLPSYPWAHRSFWLAASPAIDPLGPATNGSADTDDSGFPGTPVTSPALLKPVYELRLANKLLAPFHDHRIGGRSRLPATALLEIVRAAATEAGLAGAEVRDLGILRAVPFGPDVPGRLQIVLEPEGEIGTRAEIFVTSDGASWQLVASARAVRGGEPGPPAAPGQDGHRLDHQAFYALMERDGCDFGEGFRLLDQIVANEAVATGDLSRGRASAWGGTVHPAVVDACAQLCIAVLESRGTERQSGAFLPWAVDRYAVFGSTENAVAGRAVLRQSSTAGAAFDVDVLDAQGDQLVRIEGWRLRRAPTSAHQLRQVKWIPEGVATSDPDTAGQPWLVLSDPGEFGDRIVQAFARHGGRAVRHQLTPMASDQGWTVPSAGEGVPWAGVVYAESAEVHNEKERDGLAAAVGCVCRRLLVVGQAVTSGAIGAQRLLVVTRATQAAGDIGGAAPPLGGGVWGLSRAIRAEIPDVRCTSLDLDMNAGEDDADWVVREALADRADHEVAIRDGVRLVARLAPLDLEVVETTAAGPYSLVHRSPGTLDRFSLQEAERPVPGPGEVTVQILAAGMNFRDVLTALGTYPGEAKMGHECCGRVTAVGEHVTDVRIDDVVLVFWPGCFGSHVTAPRSFVFPTPRGLNPVEAATIPVVFATAYHALYRVAHVKKGMNVLVHSGAGGVGMAAIQLARRAGADVYATAGSREKRALVKNLGAVDVFDSRSPSFESDIRQATGGEGVHVVINSLIGDMIPAGLRCLCDDGVFIELGKREVLSVEQVRGIRSGVRYEAFDLRDEAERDPTLLPTIFDALVASFERGDLTPLPSRAVRMGEAATAFRRMARGGHVGKVVLVPGGSRAAVERPGWIVVSGGLGALGLATAGWLVQRGARNLALVGRGDPGSDAARAVEDLKRSSGADIRTLRADVSDAHQVSAVLETLRESGLPVVGVIHAAGVVDDAMIAKLTDAQLAAVLAPKVAGAWNLHRATEHDPIALFLLYSAAGPVLSGAGQANYAAANGFLDSLATYRRGIGLPAVSVQWGPWAGNGMAERLTDVQRSRWQRLGLASWTPETGAAVLDQLLGPIPEQVLALRLTEAKRVDAKSGGPSGREASLTGRVRSLPPRRRAGAIRDHVRKCVTTILGRESAVAVDVPLRDLGLDSLSAIEVRNALAVAVGIPLPATLAFDYPTVEAIAGHLDEQLGSQDTALDRGREANLGPDGEVPKAARTYQEKGDAEEAAGQGGDTLRVQVATELDQLSDEEAEALLLLELEDGDGGDR